MDVKILKEGDIVFPKNPAKSNRFLRTCGLLSPLKMKSFTGKRCTILTVGGDKTARIENPGSDIAWWTLEHLRSQKK